VKHVQSPICLPEAAELLNGLLDPDAKQTRSPQVLSARAISDQPKRRLEPESIIVTGAPALLLPLPSQRSMTSPLFLRIDSYIFA
jgi:hypothetical protein